MIYDRELNEIELSQLEGYIAHKWQMNNELLPSSHPYFSIDPFGGSSSFVKTVAVGGDRPVVKIFWGDDDIESNSTEIDSTDNTKWDHVFEINASNPVGLGNYLPKLMVWILINSTISRLCRKFRWWCLGT